MRLQSGLVAVVVSLLLSPLAARADVEDLSTGESRHSRRTPWFAIRGEAGSDFSPYGRFGACVSFFTENPLGGAEIEVGGGTGLPGVQLGLGVRQLVGDGADFFVFEISIAGNSVRQLGYDPAAGHFQSSHYWSSLGIGVEHRVGFFTLGVVGALSFTTSFDLVPHAMVHGGAGLAF